MSVCVSHGGGSKTGTQNGLPWQVEAWTKTCCPIGGLVLTHHMASNLGLLQSEARGKGRARGAKRGMAMSLQQFHERTPRWARRAKSQGRGFGPFLVS